MVNLRDFSFVGISRLNGAKSLLPATIEHWMRQWCFDAGGHAFSVTVEDASNVLIAQQYEASCWLELNGSIWLNYDEITAQKIIFSSYATQLPIDNTARTLLRLALESLLESVMTNLGHTTTVMFEEHQLDHPYRFGNALVIVIIKIQMLELRMFIDAKLLNQYLPKRNNTLVRSLVKRQEAIAQTKVRINIALPLAEVQVNELSHLNIGDIIRGQVLLNQPFHVSIEDGLVIANAHLGRQQQKIAIQLTETPKKPPLERLK